MKKLMPLYHLIATESSAEDTFRAATSWLFAQYPKLSRLCVASVEGDEVYSFFVHDRLAGSDDDIFYQSRLSVSRALAEIAQGDGFECINDLQPLAQHHSQLNKLYQRGHRSSFTFAIKANQQLIGYLFLNSDQLAAFEQSHHLDEYLQIAQLLTQVKIYLYRRITMLRSGLGLTLKMGHARDPETEAHLERMSAYSVLIASHMAQQQLLNNTDVVTVRRYARYHDIGKYQIQDDILFSTERFTPEQRAIMNQHCQYGVDIINHVELGMGVDDLNMLRRLKNIILHHHERFDGKGYPHGLKGKEIPIEARIVTVADVFDALLSDRKYKGAWPFNSACQFLKDNSGTMFDPDCVDALLAQLDEVDAIRERYVDELE
ncbi:HD-GYP domain-containing protein [Ferrimonas lipolytica]|uniref:HD domain-containing protein n=1 Tax=Ferrimonas lipolytica TaxID=2724191 RepID=A0A6H1U9V7_9GAMM|nr:HD domain-containing phosphohydrolase [Ferrimonas lipolytica]QIZ75608.1 HD domain-containing protein [Ferrimonas lipolytica]